MPLPALIRAFFITIRLPDNYLSSKPKVKEVVEKDAVKHVNEQFIGRIPDGSKIYLDCKSGPHTGSEPRCTNPDLRLHSTIVAKREVEGREEHVTTLHVIHDEDEIEEARGLRAAEEIERTAPKTVLPVFLLPPPRLPGGLFVSSSAS